MASPLEEFLPSRPGPPDTVEPEVWIQCVDLLHTRDWTYDKIAQHLKATGVASHPDDPTKPVHRSTIMRWIKKGEQLLVDEQKRPLELRRALSIRYLQNATAKLHALEDIGPITDIKDMKDFIDSAVKLFDRRMTLEGTAMPKLSSVTITEGGDEPDYIPDPELVRWEREVQAKRDRQNLAQRVEAQRAKGQP